jgi:peptidoglycan/xylan/chitin deacetylase (PgdA/CDA1 family)
MYINNIPGFIRQLLPSHLEWEVPVRDKKIFLTFDDGPIPDVTPWVLDTLKQFQALATFFCVGDNVGKHPDVFQELKQSGNLIGNHTYNHLKAWKTKRDAYLLNIARCNDLVNSHLFRPPHGQITPQLARIIGKEYRIIMWSILSRDFDPQVSPYQCLKNSVEQSKPGTIIVFHDSLKARKQLEYTLPRYLEHFSKQGYSFLTL